MVLEICVRRVQERNARDAAAALALLVQAEHLRLCITHGNGPQVGLLAEQVMLTRKLPLSA